MRILLINSYHFNKGGADNVYFNTARLLKQKGHDVFFFSTSHKSNLPSTESDYFSPGVNFREVSLVKKVSAMPAFVYNKKSHNQLVRLISKIKPDVAHVHLFLGGLSSSILTALQKQKVPVVQTVHDYRLICPAYLFLDGKNKVCERCKDRFYMHCVTNKCSDNNLVQSTILAMDAYFRKYVINPIDYIDKFIFVSKFIRDKHIEFNSKFKSKATHLYNFVPDLNLVVSRRVRGKYFLFYGRLSREKGIETLLQAAKGLELELKIVGTGPLISEQEKFPYSNIRFLGQKRGAELWSLVENASFVIVPSEWYENNPLTILESYSLGKPVIGSRIGGIPEIIEDGRTGYLFEPGNISELQAILNKTIGLSDDEYSALSTNAKEFAKKYFDPDDHAQHLLEIYKAAIDDSTSKLTNKSVNKKEYIKS